MSLSSFLFIVCLIFNRDASGMHRDGMACPRVFLAETTASEKVGNDVAIAEGRQVEDIRTLFHDEDENFWRTKTQTHNSHTVNEDVLSSSLSGDTVTIATGNDFTLRGSDVAASSGVSVEAGGDVSITVADASSSSETFDKKTRSGFSFSGGGGISYGKSEQGKNARDDSDYHVGSLLGTENGDVTLNAGKDVSVESSQIVSGTGDVAISGENVTIENEYDAYDSEYREYSKEKSIGISIGLNAPVVDAVTGIANAAKRRRRRTPPSTGRAFSIDFTAHPHVHFYRRNTCIANGRKP